MGGLREPEKSRFVSPRQGGSLPGVRMPVVATARPAVVVPPPVGPAPLRLTRRGRWLCRALLALTATLALLSVVIESRADASGPSGPPPVVVVEPGDTLWNIATSHAPDGDPYVVMEEIRRLNRMPDSTVRVGERLLLPRR